MHALTPELCGWCAVPRFSHGLPPQAERTARASGSAADTYLPRHLSGSPGGLSATGQQTQGRDKRQNTRATMHTRRHRCAARTHACGAYGTHTHT